LKQNKNNIEYKSNYYSQFALVLKVVFAFFMGLLFSLPVIFIPSDKTLVLSFKSSYIALFYSLFLFSFDVKKRNNENVKIYFIMPLLLLIDVSVQLGVTYLIYVQMIADSQSL
jgi:hypothetical protein